jgi:hypothetical protein
LIDGPGPGAGSARPGGAVLDANSYTADRASDFASSAVMK